MSEVNATSVKAQLHAQVGSRHVDSLQLLQLADPEGEELVQAEEQPQAEEQAQTEEQTAEGGEQQAEE